MGYLAGAPDSEIEGRKGPALLWEEMEGTPRAAGAEGPNLDSSPLQPATCSLNHIYSQ